MLNIPSDETHRLPQLIDTYLDLPFNRFLGLNLLDLNDTHCKLQFPRQDVLIGNSAKSILHGGVISSAMDSCGGLLMMSATLNKLVDLPPAQILEKMMNSATIDLRVDYLRPGKGEHFVVSAELLRSGKRISVTRMDLHNEQNVHIAAGAASYWC